MHNYLCFTLTLISSRSLGAWTLHLSKKWSSFHPKIILHLSSLAYRSRFWRLSLCACSICSWSLSLMACSICSCSVICSKWSFPPPWARSPPAPTKKSKKIVPKVCEGFNQCSQFNSQVVHFQRKPIINHEIWKKRWVNISIPASRDIARSSPRVSSAMGLVATVLDTMCSFQCRQIFCSLQPNHLQVVWSKLL